ncbi:MAG: type II toxin-antitoxin system RelE/ParE family toxin [Bacteriovoracaceae bacterium]|nr:type II toxin-antitoxin system RelE/ParE family toxin [Bacteriovoracaceae bacterium]
MLAKYSNIAILAFRKEYCLRIEILDQAAKILRAESREIKEDLKDILEKLELGLTLGLPHVRPLTSIHSNLFEIRVKDKKGQFRVIYFVKKKDAIYILHAFRKKSQKMPQKEKSLILKRIKEMK